MFKKVFSGIVALSLAAGVLVLPASAYSTRQGGDAQNQQQNSSGQQNNERNQSNGKNSSFTIPQQYMIDQGIMRGDGQGNYNLTGTLSRGAMMVMLVRAFDLNSDGNDTGSGFSDVSSGSYYADAINTAKNLGIARGNGSSFSPNSNVTIQQAILFIERAAEQAGITPDNDLESYFDSSELSEPATREDIANLLYYVLTGNETGLDGTDSSDTDIADEITYTSSSGAVVNFEEDDFSSVIYDATDGETLSYVTFSLPSSNCGTLYYDYSSSSSSNVKVSASTNYYVGQEKYLSDVTFVPSTSYTGTATIRYTGYTTDGTAVSGTIRITVKTTIADAISYDYDIDNDEYILFDSSDFSSACGDALGDDYTLSYVTFTLPSSSEGNLYYNYSTSTESGTAMTKATKCYLSNTPKLSKVAFVNGSDNDDDVTISYTGYTTDGIVFTGTVDINID